MSANTVDALKIPRDLYAGHMVTQMIKEGYYPEEFSYFGCAYWQEGEVAYLISTDEKVVYDAVEHIIGQGIIVSPVLKILRRLRVHESEKMQVILALQEELKQKLIETFPRKYFSLLSTFASGKSHNTAYPILEQYRKTLPEQGSAPIRWNAFIGLVIMAKIAKTLDKANYQALLQGIEKSAPMPYEDIQLHTFTGFAYLGEGNQWQYYANGYRPLTVAKKLQLTEQRVLTTPILEHSSKRIGPVNVLKGNFIEMMQDIFVQEYLAVVQQLHALPPAINKESFLMSQQALAPELSPIAIDSIQGYGFIWRAQ